MDEEKPPENVIQEAEEKVEVNEERKSPCDVPVPAENISKDENPDQVKENGTVDQDKEIEVTEQEGKDVTTNSNEKAEITDEEAGRRQNDKPKPIKEEKKTSTKPKRKYVHISYTLTAKYLEKKFISELANSLKTEYNLQEDLWFDKYENCLMASSWMAMRMESIERCKAAVIILSSAYLNDKLALNEVKTLIERNKERPKSVRMYLILYEPVYFPGSFTEYLQTTVNLKDYSESSPNEKSLVVVGCIGQELEKRFSSTKSTGPAPRSINANSMEYKKKGVMSWSVDDVQCWLSSIGVHDFHKDSFAERDIDGFLLASLSEDELVNQLMIDNRHLAKKIPEQVNAKIKQEMNSKDAWHYHLKLTKPKLNSVYLIYDPSDVHTAHKIKKDLEKRRIHVVHHSSNLGQTRDDFLKENGATIASSGKFLVILSETAGASPFVYNEVIFVDWLGRSISTLYLRGGETRLRAGLNGILRDHPATYFDLNKFTESMDVVEYLIKPAKSMPNSIVLEQSFINKLTENTKLLYELFPDNKDHSEPIESKQQISVHAPLVYLSYHWDMQIQVHQLAEMLYKAGVPFWADFDSSATPHRTSEISKVNRPTFETTKIDTLQNQIVSHIKHSAAVICCFSNSYATSKNCHKDVYTACTLSKPVLPILLRNTRFPPDSPQEIKTIMTKYKDRLIDLSSPRLMKQNFPKLVHEIRRFARALSTCKEEIIT